MVQSNPIWPVEQRFPQLGKDLRKDVLVIGGGMAGVSCAYRLKKAGYDVALIERDQIGGPATGGSSGVLYYGSGLNYVPAIQQFGKERADRMWKETAHVINEIIDIAEKEHIDCGVRSCGAVMVARTDPETIELEDEYNGLHALGFPTRLLSSSDLKGVYPMREFREGIAYDAVGQIHPARFAAGLAKVNDMEIYEGTPYTNCKEEGESVTVTTPQGQITCSTTVIATNIEPCMGLENFCEIESSVILASQPTDRVKDVFPNEKILWTMDEKYDMLYPRGDRLILELYALGEEDQKLAYYFPGVQFTIEKNWGEVWTKPADWVPIVGKTGPRVAVAMGMGDQGIIMSWLSGSKMPGVLEGKKDWFTDMASPSRFKM